MPPTSRPTSHIQCILSGSPWPRRLVTLIQGALLLVIILCAVAHGETEETHGPAPAAVTAPAATPGGAEPHGPHAPHGDHACASDLIVRTTVQALDQPVAETKPLAVVAAGAVVLGHPLVLRRSHRRRRPRTGRAALVRTSRWRI
ncbi:hypothetical protein PV396_43120 [Streptomyces sp. ME02-8801-2C]|uniref:hypothetical protein n=1 Tax=Streptomyces sp. ME02-8801-2C TaxID=3028680 RepID=UPI0029BF958C|nr:hypothetical protein [Streptomyces sp. ME02-8801-2C]MDX3458643.1 hypothetical protein [Streptomyces sp. ME02-8801-2C]